MAVLQHFDKINTTTDKLNGSTLSLQSNAGNNIESTMSTDSEDYLDIQQELKNIKNVISLTRANIDALNAKFADFQRPPALYLKEYEDLTSKLHELEAEKLRLMEFISNGRDSPVDEDEISETSSKNRPTTKFLRAHLPNQQRTSVQVREGLSLAEALAKPMNLRNLSRLICSVYVGESEQQIPWDTDISTLKCEEITVKIVRSDRIASSISHNFVRKTFFSLVFCENCRRLLFQGFYCRTCGYKFHQRCTSGVPSLCHAVSRFVCWGHAIVLH